MCLVTNTSAGQHLRTLACFRWEKGRKWTLGGKSYLTRFAWTFSGAGEKVGSPGRPSFDIPVKARAS